MIKRKGVLFSSLALGLCLLEAGSRFLITRSEQARSADGDEGSPLTPSDSIAQPAAGAGLPAFDWRQMESSDYRTYIANLRELGCPDETIQDIIMAEINKLYAPKIAAAQQRPAVKGHYWQRQPPWSPQAFAEQNEIFKEKNAVIKELLGIDLDQYNRNNHPATNDPDGPLAFIPEAKQQRLQALQDKYRGLEAGIYADAHGLITAEDRAALAALQQQKSAEMNALLTPNERLEYGLRNSSTARKLQQDLEAFQPTEAEFRAIYQAQIALYEKSQTSSSGGPDDHSAQSAADQAETVFEAQLKAALGEQRYAEYQKAKDPSYQTLVKIADRFGLSQDVATQVLDLKQNAELQKQQVQANANLNANEKQAWLQALHDQVGATLSTVLGDKGFSVYHDYSGSWIDRLEK